MVYTVSVFFSCVSPFDANARRQTSFAAIEVMPEIEDDAEIEIREEDIQTVGAGGQHVNKTSCCA